jgi:polyferredoxin
MLLIGNMTCAYAVDLNVLAEWWMSADEVTVSHMSVGTPQAARGWVSWLALLLGAVAVVLGALALFASPAPRAINTISGNDTARTAYRTEDRRRS